MLQKYHTKNQDLQVFIKDKLYHRSEAKISVFDSAVQGGDAVWEGIRVYKQGVFCLKEHIERLQHSAKAMLFSDIPSYAFIEQAIFTTLQANNLYEDAHIRLTLTRGEKLTSGMDPRLNTLGSTLIVLAEYKPPVYDNANGVRVITSAIRRNSPMMVDSKIHHNNLINNILAKIQANIAGYDDALMLDAYGFVSEMNGTNIFMVKNQTLYTPTADSCLPGITRGLVLTLAKQCGINAVERNLSLTEFYTADQVFGTGTMGELTPVTEIDGRIIENTSGTQLYEQLVQAFLNRVELYCKPVPRS